MLTVLKSGSLNLLESLGPVQACNGIALLYIDEFVLYNFSYFIIAVDYVLIVVQFAGLNSVDINQGVL